jgi:hypothetical protein
MSDLFANILDQIFEINEEWELFEDAMYLLSCYLHHTDIVAQRMWIYYELIILRMKPTNLNSNVLGDRQSQILN